MSDPDPAPPLPWTPPAVPPEGLLFAGVGCTGTVTADVVLTLLRSILPPGVPLAALASLDRRCTHPALRAVAGRLSVPLLPVPDHRLSALPDTLPDDISLSPSAAARLSGLPSVAEAAALIAARDAAPSPDCCVALRVAKRRGTGCTVAIAHLSPPPSPEEPIQP